MQLLRIVVKINQRNLFDYSDLFYFHMAVFFTGDATLRILTRARSRHGARSFHREIAVSAASFRIAGFERSDGSITRHVGYTLWPAITL